MGKKLTDYTIRRVIIIVLFMLFTNPLFMVQTYMKVPDSQEYALDLIWTLQENGTDIHDGMFNTTIALQKEIETPIIALSFYISDKLNLFWLDESRHNNKRRSSEYIYKTYVDNEKNMLFLAVYDKLKVVRLSAILGICQTVGVCIILSFGAYLFTKITSDLVIDPIENMIERVKHITADPLSAIHEEEERILIDHIRSL